MLPGFKDWAERILILATLKIYNNNCYFMGSVQSVQSLSHVRLFVTPWTVACQASLSLTSFWSLPKLMSVD